MLEDFTLSSHAITSRFRTDPPIDTSFFDLIVLFPHFHIKKIVHSSNLLYLLTEFWIVIDGSFLDDLDFYDSKYCYFSLSFNLRRHFNLYHLIYNYISQLIFYILPSNVSIFISNLFCVSSILKTLITSICRFPCIFPSNLYFYKLYIYFVFLCFTNSLTILIKTVKFSSSSVYFYTNIYTFVFI